MRLRVPILCVAGVLILAGLLTTLLVISGRPVTLHQSFTVPAGTEFAWRAGDAGSGRVSFLAPLPEGMVWEEGAKRLTWVPAAKQAGTHSVGLRLDARLASVHVSLAISVVAANQPPRLTAPPAAQAEEDKPFRCTLAVADPDGDPVRVRLVEGPPGLSLQEEGKQWTLAWVPRQEHVGRHRVVLELSDDRNVATHAIDLAVAEVNDPPVIVSTPPTYASRGTPYEYIVQAKDEEGDALAYTLAAGPAGMTLDAKTGRLTWTPGADAKPAEDVAVRVTDPRGASATQAFRVVFRSLVKVGIYGEATQFVAPLDDDLLCGITPHRLKVFRRRNVNEVVGSYWTPSRSPRTLELFKGHVYLNQGNEGIDIFDVTRPSDPQLVGRLKVRMSGYARPERFGDRLLVPDMGGDFIRVYSLADPAHPAELARHGLPDPSRPEGFHTPMQFQLVDGRLYVLGDCGLNVLDAADLERLRPLGGIAIRSGWSLGGLVVRLPYAYVFTGSELRVHDVSNPAAIKQVATPKGDYGFCPYAALRGRHIIGFGGIVRQYCLDEPLEPRRTGDSLNHMPAFFLPGRDHDLLVDESGKASPMEPDSPFPSRSDTFGLVAYGVLVRDKRAYVLGAGLRILDVADPSQPRLLGSLDVSHGNHPDMHLRDGILYSSWAIVDVTDPRAPRKLADLSGGEDCTLRDDRTLFTVGVKDWPGWHDKGLTVWDVKDPAKPRVVRTVALNDPLKCLLARGDVLYAGFKSGLLRSYRVGADFTLTPLAELSLRRSQHGSITDLSADARFLYVAVAWDGVASIPLADPAKLEVHGYLQTGWANGVRGIGGIVYVACGDSVTIADLTAKGLGRLVTTYPTTDTARALDVSGPHIYVCEGRAGLSVFMSDLLTVFREGAKEF